MPFADVALIGVVPNFGLSIPALASGAGAERFAELFRPLGMPVEVVGGQPGDAAGLKLLRSVFMKGIAAAAIEALEAATAAGVEDRVRATSRASWASRSWTASSPAPEPTPPAESTRCTAAAAYVTELGIEPRIATAAAEWLAQLRDD